MSRDPRVLNSRECAFFGKHVAVTDATGLDPEPYCSWSGIRNVPLDELKRLTRSRDLHCAHLGHLSPNLVPETGRYLLGMAEWRNACPERSEGAECLNLSRVQATKLQPSQGIRRLTGQDTHIVCFASDRR